MLERPNEAERLAGLLFSAYEADLLGAPGASSTFEQAMLRGWLREEAWLAAGGGPYGAVLPPAGWPASAAR